VCAALAEAFAVIELILTAFGLMLGLVKPGDAFRRIAAILGVVIVAMVIPAILANAWSAMSFWQRLAVAAIALGIWQLARRRRRSRRTRAE
jgi:hypothetical protein